MNYHEIPVKITANSQQVNASYDPLGNPTDRNDGNNTADASSVQQLQKAIKKLAVQLKAIEKNAGSSPEAAAAAMMLSSQIAALQSDVTKVTNVGASTYASTKAHSALRQAQTSAASTQGEGATEDRSREEPASQVPALRLDLTGTQIDTTA